MICLICGKKYYEKRTLNTLFKEKISYRCHSCNKKYQININYQVIPKTLGLIHIYSLFLEDHKLNLTAFNDEINNLLGIILKSKRLNDSLVWLEELKIEILNKLDEFENDIYVITNTPYFK